MADTHIINDKTESEQISLEEEAAAIQEQEVQVDDRPEWLPDKFKTPEDLANAYNNLEGKLGSNEETQQQQEDLPPTEVQDSTEEDSQTSAIIAASDEFSEQGQLSEDTYKTLEASGLSRNLVDSYIEGQQALQASGEAELLNEIGGREAYEQISEWASEALSENQLDAYNKALETGTDEQASLALDWIKTKYEASNGVSPSSFIQGGTKGSGESAFESRAQVLAAMSERDARGKKRYEVDPAYRKEVERRLAISTMI
jgi:hypothetical protein